MKNPKLIVKPFAKNGQKNVIPENYETSMDSNQATWDQGFGQITMLPVAAGGLPPKGQDFNGILNQISENIVYQSQGGRFKFSPEYAESIGGYPKGAILQSDDEKKEYQSLIDNNKVNFNTESNISASWELIGAKYAIKTEVDLALLKKFDKANISGVKGNDNDKVPSLNLFTAEIGKLQPKGNYQPAGDYATTQSLNDGLSKKFDKAGGEVNGYVLAKNLGVSREGSTLWIYSKNAERDTAFLQYQDGDSWGGQILVPKVASGNVVSLLYSSDIVQSAGSSTSKAMSQDAATKAFQKSGNYASGDSFTHASGGSPIIMTSSGFHFRVAASGAIDAVSSDGKSVWGVSSTGQLIATINASRIDGLATDIMGGDKEIPNSPAVRKRMFGVSQTRKDVTASRALATTYTNTTDKPIIVDVVSSVTMDSVVGMIEIQVGNIVVSKSEVGGSPVSKRLSASAIVLPGERYAVRMSNVSIVIWSEIS
ncbi:hypothetical protein ACIH2S_07515 [Providencia sp. PAZ2]|uniref:hypothetical protein n=1 Tax=Providencia lanzhouensis TaxID=3378099 RepID=UPI003D2B121C